MLGMEASKIHASKRVRLSSLRTMPPGDRSDCCLREAIQGALWLASARESHSSMSSILQLCLSSDTKTLSKIQSRHHGRLLWS